MKRLSILLIFCFWYLGLFSQILYPGIYNDNLRIAYNPDNKIVTGYYEDGTGLDEATGNPQFSCIFYFKGKVNSAIIQISTFYPNKLNDTNDTITGKLFLRKNGRLSIQLPQEHGGCWNVQPFTDAPVNFNLNKKMNWLEIKFVTTAKCYLYDEKYRQLKSYLIANDFVCVDSTMGNWTHITFFGEKVIKAWVKTKDLNVLDL